MYPFCERAIDIDISLLMRYVIIGLAINNDLLPKISQSVQRHPALSHKLRYHVTLFLRNSMNKKL